jgi:hypothetical protein
MTTSLEKAFAKASSLPEDVQEQLAEQVLEDIEGELKWDQTLADSQDMLEDMARKARRAQQEGKTTNKGFDKL